MGEFLTRAWEQFVGRASGPMHFRLVLQPLVAVFLACWAGTRDARQGRPAYLWAAISEPRERRALILGGWKDVAKLFVVALALDIGYQLFVFHWLYLPQALIVAAALAIVPYLLIRGPVTRLARRRILLPAVEAAGATAEPLAGPRV